MWPPGWGIYRPKVGGQIGKTVGNAQAGRRAGHRRTGQNWKTGRVGRADVAGWVVGWDWGSGWMGAGSVDMSEGSGGPGPGGSGPGPGLGVVRGRSVGPEAVKAGWRIGGPVLDKSAGVNPLPTLGVIPGWSTSR